MLTGGFDFQDGVSYWCSVVTICLKRTVFAEEAWNRQTDRQRDRGIA